MDIPNDYKNSGILMLIAGIMNMIVAAIWMASSLCLCVNSWFTLVVAFAEIGVGAMILSGSKLPQAKIVSILGIVGGILSFSMMAVGLEVFATILLGKPEVEEYFKS
jgi:hypothetical protein